MKRAGLAVALALLCAASVPGLAQEKKKPAAAKPPEMTAKPAAAQPAQAPMAPAARPSRLREDARSCLAHPTNMEIHRCAEAYR